MITLAFGVCATAFAANAFAEADPSATNAGKQPAPGTAQIRRDEETQAWITQTIEKMNTENAERSDAQLKYEQTVERAKAEHQAAMDKCRSLADEAQKPCKERADAELTTAKSDAEGVLEKHTSAQP